MGEQLSPSRATPPSPRVSEEYMVTGMPLYCIGRCRDCQMGGEMLVGWERWENGREGGGGD